MQTLLRRFRLAAPLALAVLTLDCTTKQLAEQHLAPVPASHEVVGEVLQLTLVYNTGAAMGIPLGPKPKPVLLTAAAVILAVLCRLLWHTAPADAPRRVALGLILGGALGNLMSRLLSPHGVVDFINVGIGAWRLWVFNVADIGVISGAALLALVLWREEDPARGPTVTSGALGTSV